MINDQIYYDLLWTIFKNPKKKEDKVFSSHIWEYKILNLNVKTESNNTIDHSQSSPEIESKKLKGVFRTDFIRN